MCVGCKDHKKKKLNTDGMFIYQDKYFIDNEKKSPEDDVKEDEI